MLNFMQVNYILHGFCVPQNCPLPAVGTDLLKCKLANFKLDIFVFYPRSSTVPDEFLVVLNLKLKSCSHSIVNTWVALMLLNAAFPP